MGARLVRSDSELPALFREAARVVGERAVFPDAVECASSWVSRLGWRLEGGAFPRRAGVPFSATEAHCTIEGGEEYRMFHRCALCIARPRGGPERGGQGACDDPV